MENIKKTVLITGGSRGLGKEIVKKFASNNYNVAFTYLNSEKEAKKLEIELKNEYECKMLCLKCDVTKEDDVKNLVNIIKEEFGAIDCLVNNAGVAFDNNIYDKSLNEFKYVLDVNLVGAFNVTKQVSKIMSTGSIINVTSTDGIDTCYKEEMDYAASKAGLISLTKTMAKEFAPNIRVNAVAPGWINTDMNKEMYSEFKKHEEEKILLGRFAEPVEIANVIYFLATQEASYINGTVIRVDGGY